MSPKRPISAQRTGLRTGVRADTPKKPLADTERDTGATHDTGIDSADDVAANGPGHGAGVVPDLAHHVGAVTHADSSTVTGAAARVLGTKDAPKDTFDPRSKLDERAGRAQAERDGLRDRARHGVQDDAADGDGTTGIAEQGTDAVSAEPTRHTPAVPSNSPADMAEAKRVFENELARTNARTSDRHVYDPDSDDPLQRVYADELDTAVPDLAPLLDDPTLPELAPLSDDPVTPPPAAKTPPPAKPTTPGGGTHTVDPEHQHDVDPDRAHLTGLDDFLDRLHTPAVAGGGDTDPVDDDGFGSGAVIGAPAVVGAAGNSLLAGGDTRGSEIGSGGAGHVPVDVGGNAGAIDPGPDADPGFGAGGLEDDPFDTGQGPTREIGAADDGPDDAADDGPDAEQPAAFHLFADASPINDAVFDHVTDLVDPNDDPDDPDDPTD